MSKNKKRGTTIAVAGAVAAVAIGGGVAWAAFTKDTSATAAGKGGKLVAMTVVGTPATVYETGQTALWPGHPADIKIRVQNSNEIPLRVINVVAGPAVATDGTPTECASHIEFHGINIPNGPVDVPANGGEKDVVLVDAISLKQTAPDSCQDAKFTTSWTITGSNL